MAETVLILGSAPNAVVAADWARACFDQIVVINNAWRIRPDWDVLIHPEDFPPDRRPARLAQGQRVVTAVEYVPLQNALGGFVYAGGTMAFTAGYWALAALKPKVMAFMGCDMVYAAQGNTHFYGSGAADPLRDDVTLRSLEAKSARLGLLAATRGCRCVNLSTDPSRLVFERATPDMLPRLPAPDSAQTTDAIAGPEAEEARLGYMEPSGRYWEVEGRFDPEAIDALDRLWLKSWENAVR